MRPRPSTRRAIKGRGTGENPASRFDRLVIAVDPDDHHDADVPRGACPESEPVHSTVPTEYYRDATRTLITRNDSPDIPFAASINPYRGCEHGCIYCYARPYHEYLGLSAGLDFETRIFVKEDAPEILRRELASPGWTPTLLALSGVTDPYQPVERQLGLTRRCLEALAEFRNPVGVITKNALVTRDIDLLADMAGHGAASVAISITTLDETLRLKLEPRAPTADARLEAIARLRAAGVPVGVMVAPVIAALTDQEVPAILARAAEAGAAFAGYTLLRLPHGVAALFEGWLAEYYPDRSRRVLNRVREGQGGRFVNRAFHSRMTGEGVTAGLVAEVFRVACRKAGLLSHGPALSTAAFRRPSRQGSLFDPS